MFDNIGAKIKGVAVATTCLGIISSIIYGFVLIASGIGGDDGDILDGLFVIVLGSLGSWLGSLTLYGFGQLIENSDTMVDLLSRKNPNQKEDFFNALCKPQNAIQSTPGYIETPLKPQAVNKPKEEEKEEEEGNDRVVAIVCIAITVFLIAISALCLCLFC